MDVEPCSRFQYLDAHVRPTAQTWLNLSSYSGSSFDEENNPSKLKTFSFSSPRPPLWKKASRIFIFFNLLNLMWGLLVVSFFLYLVQTFFYSSWRSVSMIQNIFLMICKKSCLYLLRTSFVLYWRSKDKFEWTLFYGMNRAQNKGMKAGSQVTA